MLTKTLSARKNLWLVLALLWTLLIAVLCLISFKKLPTVKLAEADKYVHATFHFVFTLLWFGYWRLRMPRALLMVFLGSMAYGILIEIMQSLFTETRQADIRDVAANTLGATLAVLAVLTARRCVKRNAN